MSVFLALYKGKGNWVNSIIRWRNQSIYSHCELIVDGWMYSSTVHDGGVRCKLQSYLREEDWDIIPVKLLLMVKIFFYILLRLKTIHMVGEI